ncbi:rhomboid family intramembrane serine protease [Candidatus Pacearchaeota archaeon]|nr:rhomboid family intramembrane serine protease [Candidatus Pacearchaeota archaeon]
MSPVYQVYSKPKKRFLDSISMNTLLILINVAVFIIIFSLWIFGVISQDWFAISPANILSGNYLWTFITSMFMHAGFFHLFVNMFSMFFVGSLVEKILGQKRYLYFYLVSGLFAGAFFVLASFLFFSAELNTYAVGASGALFALVGLLVILTPNLPVYVMFIPIPVKMKYAAPGLLVVLWLISIGANIPIGNTAHLGGLIAGLIYGIYLVRKFPTKTRNLRRNFS